MGAGEVCACATGLVIMSLDPEWVQARQTLLRLRLSASQCLSPPEPGRPLKRNDDEQHQNAEAENTEDKRKYQNPDNRFRQSSCDPDQRIIHGHYGLA